MAIEDQKSNSLNPKLLTIRGTKNVISANRTIMLAIYDVAMSTLLPLILKTRGNNKGMQININQAVSSVKNDKSNAPSSKAYIIMAQLEK